MRDPNFFTGRLGNRLFQTAYLYARIKDGTIPDWYLQDPEYFKGYEEEIKQLFGEGIGYLNQVGVHIRRGANPINPNEPPYSENPMYVDLCKTDYYERAMEMFDDDFLVFSDDPEWCKIKFEGSPRVQVMEKKDEVEDFNLLASCKHQIIANSSFSWWAAFLNPNETKIIVAPKQWYSDGLERTKLPVEWLKI